MSPTEQERELLALAEYREWAAQGEAFGLAWADHLVPTVERIIAEREAALAERIALAERERDGALRGWANDRELRDHHRERRAEAWDEGYMAGWGDRSEDEDNPLPAGEQHDTSNPYRSQS